MQSKLLLVSLLAAFVAARPQGATFTSEPIGEGTQVETIPTVLPTNLTPIGPITISKPGGSSSLVLPSGISVSPVTPTTKPTGSTTNTGTGVIPSATGAANRATLGFGAGTGALAVMIGALLAV